ncbi:MAG: transglycosylase domain-containing protein, partial [Anaerolineae bacterium]|nr:transglycosylase domain-containing protein [Anaerolineae bacterium]
PYVLRWATVATEDNTFYENPGFDPQSIARAAWEWAQQGEIVSGGSTITQQLVRQIVFEYEERTEQSLRRKLKEAILAWIMTQQFSKDRILELYLNEIPYGNLTYGIEAAADVYFDKHASALTLAEASFLAGIPQAPGVYDPYTDFAGVKARQRQVLDLMVLHGYLTSEEADAAFAAPPVEAGDLASPDISLVAPHFTVEVKRQLAELPGIDPVLLSRGGLRVYTTLDPGYQALAEQLAAEQVAELRDEYNLTNTALVALNPNTGEVLAMLGSVDYNDTSIDGAVNVTLSPQQPGSTMKPFTYALALEQGRTAADILWDVPMGYDTGIGEGYDYVPVNYDGRFHGPVRMRDALANSYNIPAVTTLRDVGVDNLVALMRQLGVESLSEDPARYGLSLTLGGGEVTPLELTAAYGALATGGNRVSPYLIERVTDRTGTVLYQHTPQPPQSVIDSRVAFIISSILSDNTARTPAMGSESPLLLPFPAAAKTGTTNDFRDNWTMGYTPHLVVGVWAGNTDDTPMAEGISGLVGAAPLWNRFMTEVYDNPELTSLLEAPGLPPLRSDFAPPPDVAQRPVCVLSDWRDPRAAEEGCTRTRNEWFVVLRPEEVTEMPATPTVPPTETVAPTFPPLPEELLLTPEGFPTEVPTLEPQRVEIEPGLWALTVMRLPDEARQVLAAAAESTTRPDVPGALPPVYCEMTHPYPASDTVAVQLFIAPPADPVDALRARNWAYENGVPIVPGFDCSDEVLAQVTLEPTVDYDLVSGATYRIDSPIAGDQLFGIVPITGTAAFDPVRVMYYKVELGIGENPEQWLTIGDIHPEVVSGNVLEYLHADALAPGPYVIRLVLVRTDGNFLPPFPVPITVVPAPAP